MRVSDQEFTRLRVLMMLRRMEPIGRTRLAQACGLTGTTMTEIVSDLVRRELVLEEKATTGARGRPSLDLRINAEGGYVVAAFCDWRRTLEVEIVDLSGRSVFSHTARLKDTRRLDVRAREIGDILAEAIDAGPVPKTAIKNAAVALPAIVDSRSGQVRHLETFEPGPCAFADIIEQRLDIPTTIEGDVNVLARAVHWFGDGLAHEDVITIAFGLGLGAAHYKEGFVRTGAHGVNPELGHVKAAFENGRPCVCGARGCLQTYSSISAIIDQICERTGQPRPPFFEWEAQMRRHIAAARAGEAPARDVIEQAGRYLGVAISNYLNVSDPDRIVVFFTEPGLIDLVAAPLHEAVEANTLPVLRGQARIELKALDDSDFWKGAAALALEQLYRNR